MLLSLTFRFITIIYILVPISPFKIGIHIPGPHNNDTLIPDTWFKSGDTITATLVYYQDEILMSATCDITPELSGEWNNCTITKTNTIKSECRSYSAIIDDLISLSTLTSLPVLRLYNDYKDSVWIDGVMINDTTWNIFATSLPFPSEVEYLGLNVSGTCDNHIDDGNCTLSGSFCLQLIDHDCNDIAAVNLVLPSNTNQAFIESSVQGIEHNILDVYQYCNVTKIITIAVHVANYGSDSGAFGMLQSTLNFTTKHNNKMQSIQCNFGPRWSNVWYFCDVDAQSVIECENEVNMQHTTDAIIIHFDLFANDNLMIDGIKLLDSKNNWYIYDTFCTNLDMFYPSGYKPSGDDCVSFGVKLKKWSYFCMNGNENDYCFFEHLDVVLPANHSISEALVLIYSNDSIGTLECTERSNSNSGSSNSNDSGISQESLIIILCLSGVVVFICMIGIIMGIKHKMLLTRNLRYSVNLTDMSRDDTLDDSYMSFEFIHSK